MCVKLCFKGDADMCIDIHRHVHMKDFFPFCIKIAVLCIQAFPNWLNDQVCVLNSRRWKYKEAQSNRELLFTVTRILQDCELETQDSSKALL